MTLQELSDTFDTLLNSYSTQAVFGELASKAEIVLDEYEKSVFLTQALDIIVKQYFDRTLNQQGQGFDDSTRRQVDFSSLITNTTIPVVYPTASGTSGSTKPETTTYDSRGVMVNLPQDKPVLLILNESVLCSDANGTVTGKPVSRKNFVVIPINYKEYDRQMSKAYTQPLKKQAWRLFNDGLADLIKCEIIPIAGYTVDAYKIRYIRRPKPIVLINLENDGLEVDGQTTPQGCELNPIIHMDILNKAVELALSTRGGRIARQSDKNGG